GRRAARSMRGRKGAALTLLAIVALLAARAQPQMPPLEQRLGEAWRWRLIDGPTDATSVFRLVRSDLHRRLLGLDDEGFLAYDGWDWHRGQGWAQSTDAEVRDVAPLQDGLLVVESHAICTVDGGGAWKQVRDGKSPASVSQICQLPDGRIDIACD